METGLQGQLKKRQLPYAMGDLYKPEADGRFWWRDIDLISMYYLTPEAAEAAVLPSEFNLIPIPLEGLAVAGLTFAKYCGGTLEPYNEVYLEVPCLYKGQPYSYIPAMYVTTDQAMAGGRELLGFPKKLATIEMDALGTQFTGRLSRQGAHLASISFNQGKMLFSVPLPAQEQVVLPPPFDLMVVLPEPTGSPQGVSAHLLGTRFIPQGLAPQHLDSLWKWEQGTVWAGEGSIEYAPSDTEPLAQFPVMGVIASLLFRGDMAGYGVQVLTDMA